FASSPPPAIPNPSSLSPRATCFRSRISPPIPNSRKNAPLPFGRSPPAPPPSCSHPSQLPPSALARTIRRGESFDLESLLAHLNTVGYTSTDVVEMPGQYAVRGGILDVYSPEADRPLRIEFFGDEADSIRKFDPASQRSSNPVDEAVLLPLTETPISEHLLGAIHTRLSGKRITGSEEIVEAAVRAGGLNVFPGWEFYTPVAGADR